MTQPDNQKQITKPNKLLPRLLMGFSIVQAVVVLMQVLFVVPTFSKYYQSLNLNAKTNSAYLYATVIFFIDALLFGFALFFNKKQKDLNVIGSKYVTFGWILLGIAFIAGGKLLSDLYASVMEPIFNLSNTY